ncbi:uncharacterized protein LOC105840057 [Monomorium pharaonis]|uniref:uncharacterized protein LOC105840057 n=1 Tax=Monomorium pharaonis TaxID=307658 RepID=UPI0017468A78|nr:uncharacterized protein LOC105840057 [Monomorium pharaonis]XP_036148274.1 uncharacterized protein LOC105840057 [Monomorium pharaonis]XP_036148275.1 uncharacterized protein LOC105840057 [Monomorium pharaonis]
MPNENVCACGVVVDLPKSRSSSVELLGKLTILLPKTKGNRSESKGSRKQLDDGRVPKTRTTSSEIGSSSTVTEPARVTMKSSKHEKRLTHSRRTRSADRAESHYTYIDSGSSILSGGIRENTIPEALYATIPDTPSVNETTIGTTSRPMNSQNRSQPLYSAIPSMTSPPPTYDVAIARTWQTGLPPTYEEYLYHKYAMMSRSHTPPPPWSDSTTTTTTPSSNPTSSIQARRELLASQPELREYLAQLALSDRGSQHQYQQQRQQSRDAVCVVPREQQQVRVQQRARAMPPRSQSESRAQQQRIAAMYTDAAFCMETTVLQSAFDSGQGFALCSLM